MDPEIWTLSASALATAVTTGEISATDVIEAHLDRIAAVNPPLNAVTRLLGDTAREAAARIDRRRAAGEHLGPLAGVPFTVKDNIHVAGSATTFGVPRFEQLIAARDAPPVRRLRAAGAIPIGRTNLPDLTIAGLHTASTLYGDTVNPWNPAVTPGGSSGGDGVAVATGMAPLGLGNDSGGSLRAPAAFNGVAALKASYGRYALDHRLGPDEPVLSSQLFPVDGPLARTVADLAAVHAVLSGADPADPRAVPAPLHGPPVPARVGLVTGPGLDPGVRAGLETAAEALRDAGYTVEDTEVPRLQDALDAYADLIATDFAQTWPQVRSLLTGQSRRHVEYSMERRPPVDLPAYIALTATRLGIQRAWASFFTGVPLMLGPVSTQPPPAPGAELRDASANARVMGALALCTASTFTGNPAVAVPAGVVDGLPVGVQLVGGMYREDLCLAAASAIEERLGTFTPIGPRPCRNGAAGLDTGVRTPQREAR